MNDPKRFNGLSMEDLQNWRARVMCHIDCKDCASKRESIAMEINRRLAIKSSLRTVKETQLNGGKE